MKVRSIPFGLAVCVLSFSLAFDAHSEDYEINVGATDAEVVLSSASDAHVQGLLAGDVKDRRLYKTGKGRLVINYDFRSVGYKGEIRIHEGYLRVQHDGALGTTDAGTFVDDGATLEGDCSLVGDKNLLFTNEDLTFAGTGVDGSGCVKMVQGSCYPFFNGGKKTMTGDALWNGESGRMDIRFGTFDMGGHDFSITNTIAFTGCTVVNPGNIHAWSNFTIDTQVDFAGDSNHTIYLEEGVSRMQLQTATIPIKWSIDLANSVQFMLQANHAASITNMQSAVSKNVISGPINIASGKTINVNTTYVETSVHGKITDTHDPYHHLLTLSGYVSGGGKINISGTGGQLGYCRLLNDENDFTGGVNVGSQGILEAASIASLGTGTLTVDAAGKLRFLYDTLSPSWMNDDRYSRIFSFNANLCASDGFYSSHTNIIYQGVPDYVYNGNEEVPYSGSIYHCEENTLTIAKIIENSPLIKNIAGTIVIDGEGAHNLLGNIIVNDGTFMIANGASAHLGDNHYEIAGVYPARPRIFVGTNATFCCRGDNPSQSLVANAIGGGKGSYAKTDFARGILEISPGAIVTNQFNITVDSAYGSSDYGRTNSAGAVYMRGGTLVQHSKNSNTGCHLGNIGDAYFEMEDGFFDCSKGSEWLSIGYRRENFHPASHAVFHMKGGTLQHSSIGFVINNGGAYGLLRQSGGLVTNNNLAVGSTLWVGTGKDHNEGVLTIEGSAVMHVDNQVDIGGISNSISIVNFNGGRLEALDVIAVTNRRSMTVSRSTDEVPFLNANNKTYVNFNGGEFKSLRGDKWSSWLDGRATRHTVFAGGATLDVGQYNRLLSTAFRAPSGKGVKSIVFSCSEPWKYIGSPYVRIIDPTGNGYGASAAADFDSHTGTITGITVMSPGCDYGVGTYAEISFGGSTNIVKVEAVLETTPNTGDFVKKGGGLLSIREAPIEIGGWLRIREGSAEIVRDSSVTDVLPNLSGIEIAYGSSLSLSSNLTMKAFSYAGAGTIWSYNELPIAGKLLIDAADIVAGRCLKMRNNGGFASLTIADGTKLEISNVEQLSSIDRQTILESDVPINGAELTFADASLAVSWHFRKTCSNNKYRIKIARTHPVIMILR